VTPDTGRVKLSSGIELNTLGWPGKAGGKPFLLSHGLASNCRTWVGVGRRLHQLGHPVVAVDLRGHGRSDKPDDGYTLATMAGDLAEVIGLLGLEKPIVAGQSTGGNIALELAARSPELVYAIVGVDGGTIDLQQRWPDWDDCAKVLAPPRLAGQPRADVEAWIRNAHPDWSPEGVEATLANFETLPDDTIRPWLTFEHHMEILRSLWEHRPAEHYEALATPVLLVPADSGDGWTESKRLSIDQAMELIPRPRVRWFAPADHDIHIQFPAELANLLHAAAEPGFFRS